MGYVGNQQTEGFSQVPAKQDLTGATGTSLTLTHAVASAEGIDLFINNVRQEPTEAYSVVGTAVTLTGSVVATDDIYVVYNSLALQTTVPPDASVSTAKIIDGNVTSAKLDTNIDIAGTLDSTGVITADAGIKLGTGTDILSSFSQGTWTPEFADAATGGNVSSTSADANSAQYVKIGALVFVTCRFSDINTTGLNGTGAALIRNLPYTPNANAMGSAWRQNISSSTQVVVRVIGGLSYIRFERLRDGTTDVTLNVSNFTDDQADVIVSVTYTTDE